MKTKQQLYYAFKVDFKSCADNGQWIERFGHHAHNDKNPYEIAGKLAADYMAPTERGVRVRFLGTTESRFDSDNVVAMNPFTLTIERS